MWGHATKQEVHCIVLTAAQQGNALCSVWVCVVSYYLVLPGSWSQSRFVYPLRFLPDTFNGALCLAPLHPILFIDGVLERFPPCLASSCQRAFCQAYFFDIRAPNLHTKDSTWYLFTHRGALLVHTFHYSRWRQKNAPGISRTCLTSGCWHCLNHNPSSDCSSPIYICPVILSGSRYCYDQTLFYY